MVGRWRARPVVRCVLGTVGLFAAGACGASQGAADARPTTPSADGGGDATAGEGATTTAKRPLCDDGTCVACGDGICPPGFYCERAHAGATPACAWVAACAQKPSCGCVSSAAKGCACEDKAGTAFVSCE